LVACREVYRARRRCVTFDTVARASQAYRDYMDFKLTDGTRVLIRPIQPGDRDRLAAAYDRLSVETIHSRFLSAKPRLSPAELRYLTQVDGSSHVAFVAVLADEPEHIAGVGRFIRSAEDPGVAEVAVTVGDCYQDKGLGRRLGVELADAARARGITRFTATMLASNEAAHRLFARVSERLETIHVGPLDELAANIAA
jgi:RimJ/RimL family protein N-acetyltransferase